MLRRFNYTGRKKILREDVPISLQGSKPLWYFQADLNGIGKYELPPDARVFVEAYEQASYMRFDLGTVGNITLLSKESRVLSEFEGSDGMRFRLKVVDSSPEAKLLAEADGILPLAPEDADENKLPLLPVRHSELGQELWKISFEDGTQNMPTLLVNEIIDDRIAFVRSPAFIALAWPGILREILVRVLIIDGHTDLDDEGDWHSLWLRFARRIVPVASIPSEEDAAYLWISDVVSAFCNKNGLVTKYKQYEEEGSHGGTA